MDLLYYSEVYDPSKEEFVDVMRVSMSSGTAIGSAELITDQHFTGTLDPNKISLMTPQKKKMTIHLMKLKMMLLGMTIVTKAN